MMIILGHLVYASFIDHFPFFFGIDYQSLSAYLFCGHLVYDNYSEIYFA